MPNPLFDIEEREIVALTEPEFVDVLNKLLKAEAQKFGIPVQAIDTTMRLNDPDGGVDAKIDHNITLPSSCRIPDGLSVWQYKHGGSSLQAIRHESSKQGVQNAIDQGGSYCYVIGRGYGQTALENRQKVLDEVFLNKGLTPKSKLFIAQKIADWVSEYPSVAMLPYFRRPVHDELMTFDTWAALPYLRIGSVTFEADQQRNKIIADIGNEVKKSSSITSMRIAGRAGVGKTRLVFEAIRANQLDLRTIYVTNPEGIPHAFFSYIEAHPRIQLILVVDETTYDEAIRLHQLASRCKGQLFIITIGQDPTQAGIQTEIPSYQLNALDDGAIKKVIKQAVPTIHPELLAFVVNAAGGYVKLATALADSIVRNPSIAGAARLSGLPDVSRILESLVPDKNERKVMEALSLLRRVGLDGEVDNEGKTLADFFNLNFLEMKSIVSNLIKRGLVVKRGRYRYVTPHLLAVWFAASTWDALGENIVRELLLAKGGLTPIAALSLLERLADLGEEEIATPVVESLLSDARLFSRLEDLNDEFRSRLFATLSDAAPKIASDALDRILGHLPRDQLSLLTTGRRQVVWVLEKLLMWEESFWIAARLLLKLAEAENESYANNATGVWCNIFQTHLGNTPVPAIERHLLIREALGSDLISTRLIGIQALQRALSTYETGMSGLGAGGYITPQPWQPKTWGELWEVRRSALRLLDQAINDTSNEVATAARKVLINTAQDLVKQGLFDDVIPRLRNLTVSTEQEKIELWELYKRILHFLGKSLNEEQGKTLDQLASSLLGDSYHDRLRRWVGKVSSVDWKELKDQGKKTDEMTTALAEEGFTNPEVLKQELSWLCSEEAVQGFLLFKRLGELDEKHEWMEKLIDAVRGGGNPNVLSAYLLGRADSGEGKWVTKLLDEWSDSDQSLSSVVYETTRRLEGSDEGAIRIIKLIDKSWLVTSQLGWLGWGKWLETLSSQTIIKFLDRLMVNEDLYSAEISLVIMMNWLQHHPDEGSSLLNYASNLLTRTSVIYSKNMMHYYWEQLSEFYIDDLAIEIAQAILLTLVEAETIYDQEDARLDILRQALIKKPKEIWPLIGELLLRRDMKGFELRLSMRNWGVENAGTQNLIEWAVKNEPFGPCILAEMAVPMSDLAQELLIRYTTEECIGNALMGTFLSGSFSGPESQWLQSKLDTARIWEKSKDSAVKSWAQRLVSFIEDEIKRAKLREEEELF